MRILPRPFLKGMLIAVIPVALFFNFKSNTAHVVREKITPQAAMTVSLTEADFLTQVQEDHVVS